MTTGKNKNAISSGASAASRAIRPRGLSTVEVSQLTEVRTPLELHQPMAWPVEPLPVRSSIRSSSLGSGPLVSSGRSDWPWKSLKAGKSLVDSEEEFVQFGEDHSDQLFGQGREVRFAGLESCQALDLAEAC